MRTLNNNSQYYTKHDLQKIFECGHKKIEQLIQQPSFPRRLPIINKWVKEQVHHYISTFNQDININSPSCTTDDDYLVPITSK